MLAAYEESGKLIGHRILPVVGLRPGYRHISLRNEIGQPLNYASLFVHIEVQDYVPHKLSALAEALANPIAYQSMIEKRSKQLEALTDDESNRERAENEAADIEIEAEDNLLSSITGTGKGFFQLSGKDESNKENLEKRLGDDEHDQADANTATGNVTSLTRRMKSVRNFFAGSSSGGTTTSSTQPPQQSISSGLAAATSAAITAPNTAAGQTSSSIISEQSASIINQTAAAAGSLANTAAGANVAGLAAGTPGSDAAALAGGVSGALKTDLLQRQDTQTNLGAANQSAKTTTETTASNQLDISDVPSVLESQEVINQEAESLAKLREHKRVVKVQLEMDRELAGLRKKHNKQLEKEITTMNAKREKLMACQSKQRSLLAKTHSKLSRKSVSTDK